jgi:NAD(P)-dependent dehydrogenase (short-subunit alcohol dehydrogenase family)
MPYSVTKGRQLPMVEGLAYKSSLWVRVDAVYPGSIVTPWNLRYEKVNAMKEAAPLKYSVDLEGCAAVFFMLVGNESITGNITVNCGLARAPWAGIYASLYSLYNICIDVL